MSTSIAEGDAFRTSSWNSIYMGVANLERARNRHITSLIKSSNVEARLNALSNQESHVSHTTDHVVENDVNALARRVAACWKLPGNNFTIAVLAAKGLTNSIEELRIKLPNLGNEKYNPDADLFELFQVAARALAVRLMRPPLHVDCTVNQLSLIYLTLIRTVPYTQIAPSAWLGNCQPRRPMPGPPPSSGFAQVPGPLLRQQTTPGTSNPGSVLVSDSDSDSDSELEIIDEKSGDRVEDIGGKAEDRVEKPGIWSWFRLPWWWR
ncbi:hypothetical protein BKA67DRAFT_558595 [Truncatella angustata]|uniref:Uncharacterized protein n=1 Tax=Truncatella angustata TaxID=152316 RepID=A0A9P8UUV5_9PEZI|nr:uncharacterized protein BKA67DRAFT_558595 [Truncatella angustata]KAH6658629.1 hypothetical protein BKA67DRAFT_558595 [Truncatella angustata]